MNKTLLISVAVLGVVGLTALVFWIVSPGQQSSTTNPASGQNAGLPAAGTITPVPTTSTPGIITSVPVAGGGTIQVNNIINDPATVKDPVNPGYYYLGYHTYEGVPDSTATDNPPYVILYIEATHYFNITLLKEPIGTVREEAEQYLMTHLGISQDQMCQLNYTIGVPNFVNSQFAEELGFSFCPGATLLPK